MPPLAATTANKFPLGWRGEGVSKALLWVFLSERQAAESAGAAHSSLGPSCPSGICPLVKYSVLQRLIP